MNTGRRLYQFCKKTLEAIMPTVCVDLMNKYKTGIKYIISGGASAVVDLGLLYMLVDMAGLRPVYAAIIAFVFALMVSFVMHKFWTFRENSLQRMKKQFIFFTSLALLNLALNTTLFYIAVEIYGIWHMQAQFFIMGGLALVNFAINKTITFRHEHKTGKNILLATGIYPPDIGGPATYSQLLYEELPKYGFNVKVVTYSDVGQIQNPRPTATPRLTAQSGRQQAGAAKLKIQNKSQAQNSNEQNIYRISRQQPKILRYFKYFWQVLKLLNWANIVYAQGPVSEGLPVYWACRLRGRKYILKVVGDYAWEQWQNSELRIKNSEFVTVDEFQNKTFDAATERKRRVQKKVARGADKIIVPSEYLKKIVKQWGVAEEKINVVYNAVAFIDVQSVDKPAGEKWLVSVGRLVPWKGMEMLVEIMPELLRSEPNLKLKIIGDGPQRVNLELRIQNLELHNSVALSGRISHQDTLAYLQAADVFVLNTGYEGLPHTVLEAMHCGAPVITTPVGGNAEVIENGQSGLLVEYNDTQQWPAAILKLLHDEGLAKRFVASAKMSLHRFNKPEMIEHTIAILKQ